MGATEGLDSLGMEVDAKKNRAMKGARCANAGGAVHRSAVSGVVWVDKAPGCTSCLPGQFQAIETQHDADSGRGECAGTENTVYDTHSWGIGDHNLGDCRNQDAAVTRGCLGVVAVWSTL